MSTDSPSTDEPPPITRQGWALVAVGGIVLIWAVLRVTGAAYGTEPTRNFAERRSYDMIKPKVHEVFPLAFVQGLAGVGLMIVGARRRRAE